MGTKREKKAKHPQKELSTAHKVWRVIGIVLLCIVAVALVLLAVYHRAAYMVINNWRNPVDQAVTEESWENGKTMLNIPYADVSSSDYLDLYIPDDAENPPLLVVIHGGGFITGDTHTAQAQKMYMYFRDHGYACASVQYRMAQEAPFPACVQDVKAAIRFLRYHADEYGYDADHIAVFGESAGGYLACMAAFTNDEEFNDLPFIGEQTSEQGNNSIQVSAQVQALIDYYGCVDLTDKEPDWKEEGVPSVVRNIANSWLSGAVLQGYANPESFLLRKDNSTWTQDEINEVSPSWYVSENMGTAVNPVVWIAHGDSDITVPILQSERLYNQLTSLVGTDTVHYEVVKGAGHAGRNMYTDEELAKIEAYIHPYLFP